MTRPSVPDPDVSPDGRFRCPIKGCGKTWPAARPSQGSVAMLIGPHGKGYICPGCGLAYASKHVLRSHHDNRRDWQHRGRIVAPVPKNLLSQTELADYKQHMSEERKLTLMKRFIS